MKTGRPSGGTAFPNWKAEMVRYGITCTDIGNAVNKSSDWVENRLQGKASLPVDLAIIIRNQFFSQFSYEYLFANEPQMAKGGSL